MSIISNILDEIVKKRPSNLLSPKLANTLYDTVPTESSKLLGLSKIMGRGTSLTRTVKFTALEPVKGLMNSVPLGTRTPVHTKQAVQTEKQIIVRYAGSYVFSPQEKEQIAQAQRVGSLDAEIKLAGEKIINATAALKYKRDTGFEKIFWDGCYQQRMDVPQFIDDAASNRQIDVDTRTMTDLAGNFRWNTPAASSTADIRADIEAMRRSYEGKGVELGTVYMNQRDFDYMTNTSNANTGMRTLYSPTTTQLEKEDTRAGLNVAGIKCMPYSASWLTTDGTATKYIPNGYIIGIGEKVLGQSPVKLYNALNIDGELQNDGNGKPAYGSVFRSKTGENNDSPETRLVLTHCGCPVFENGQSIVRLKIY